MRTRVLVVDDDESVLDAISLTLTEEGYFVETTFKGEEAIKKVLTFHPDIILLDVLMSGKDGREICKTLKSNEKTRSVPVIMISAHPSAHKSIKECGADDFLAKPFDTDMLIGRIKKLLKRA